MFMFRHFNLVSRRLVLKCTSEDSLKVKVVSLDVKRLINPSRYRICCTSETCYMPSAWDRVFGPVSSGEAVYMYGLVHLETVASFNYCIPPQILPAKSP